LTRVTEAGDWARSCTDERSAKAKAANSANRLCMDLDVTTALTVVCVYNECTKKWPARELLLRAILAYAIR
jgi:hypothetical protein